jgi:hypothetical protein
VAAGLINENVINFLKTIDNSISVKESGETIPLRVLLLFVDEIFGLRAKNQWFRKRLVSMLQQFIHSAFGSAINKRIVDAVNWICSEPQVAQYLIALRFSHQNF